MPLVTRLAALAVTMLLTTGDVALAHDPALVTPGTFWSSWSLEPVVLLAITLSSYLYARGVRRLWLRGARGHGVSAARIVSFAAGQIALVVALISPVAPLGGTLLSAHMAQHGMMAGIAPPLLVIGRPGLVLAWAIGGSALGRGGVQLWRAVAAVERRLSETLTATLVYGFAVWIWHAPALFGAAARSEWMHVAQHLSFFVPAMFFWSALLRATSPRSAALAMAAAFGTFMHTGLLGGLITMAPEPLYTTYVGRTTAWSLSPLADQQLAGMLMWVPLGLPFVAVGLWLAVRLIGGARDERAVINADLTTRRV